MRNAVVCIMLFAWAGGMGLAAENKANGSRLQDLAWIIGQWQGEYLLPDGYPELGPAGAKVFHTESWRWSLAKKYIVLKFDDQIDGKTVSSGEELVGLDISTGKLMHWFFGSSGGHGQGEWSRQGDDWMLKWHGIGTGGKEIAGTSDQILIDAETYTWQMRDLTEDGKKVADWPKVTLKRTKPGTEGVTVDDYLEFHKPLLGSWKTTVEEADKTYHGTATWRLAENKKCLVISLKVEGLPALEAMIGYDPLSGKCIQTSFDSDGTYQVSMLEISGMKKGRTMTEGLIGKWEEKRFNADGTVIMATETLSCTEKGANRLVFVWSNRTERGKTLPDWKLTYERP
ncbi:MAG: hypothetical protein ACYC6Y_06395 [Thermoguttaceae bacterium]